MATGTASGKTLVYNLAFAAEAVERPTSTALYLFPTKALARDQLRAVRALTIPQMKAAVYDGDTPRAERPLIRKNANLVMTNPDMLHLALLADHARWADFFFRLSLVVVDEAHVCRGVFGSHVAMVLRRLRRLVAHYGGSPRWMLASATIGNPGELATRLTGLTFDEVVDRRRAVGREAVRALEPADHRRGQRDTAERAHRGVVADVTAGPERHPHDRLHPVAASRGAAGRVRPSRRGRRAEARADQVVSRRLPGRGSSEARAGAGERRTARDRVDERARARHRHRLARRRRARPATRARARRCGNRPGARAVGTRTRSRCWWRRTIRSTSTSCTIPRTCSTSRPRRP